MVAAWRVKRFKDGYNWLVGGGGGGLREKEKWEGGGTCDKFRLWPFRGVGPPGLGGLS